MNATLEVRVEQVIGILRNSGLDASATRVGKLLKEAARIDIEVRRAALIEIAGLFSPKSLGDANVVGIGDSEWLNLLSNVRELAKVEVSKVSRNGHAREE
jgi:hypothetical protein